MEKNTLRVRDMTQGNPIRLILGFAIPLFIGNIFQQFYSMVDTMVVGRCLGDVGIASIGATASLYSLLINFANGLNSGYGIVVTQRFGAHDYKKLRQAIAGMMVLDLGVCLVLTGAAMIFLRPLMAFLNTPEAVFEMAHSYIRIICCGILTTIGYNMFAAILRSVGNSRTPLMFLIFSSFLNIVLDLLFVLVFRMGVAGAAIATVAAQAASAVLCGIYVFRHYREFLPSKEDFHISWQMVQTLFSTGIAMALMSCLVDIGSVIFSRANNLLGQTYIAAYAASRKILMMMIQPQVTISLANSTFVGQNWGAGRFDRIRAALRKVLLMELIWSFFAMAIIYLFGGALVRFTTGTDTPEMVENAVLSLRIHFATFPFLGVLFVLRHALQGMGYKVIPVCSSCIELGMKFLSAHWLIPRIGFVGTCVTEPVTWVIMATFLLVFYLVNRSRIAEKNL
ncbi:MAG: MATE family efflux transporter [Ruminococcus sp.]